jgi:hypothetical protein
MPILRAALAGILAVLSVPAFSNPIFGWGEQGSAVGFGGIQYDRVLKSALELDVAVFKTPELKGPSLAANFNWGRGGFRIGLGGGFATGHGVILLTASGLDTGSHPGGGIAADQQFAGAELRFITRRGLSVGAGQYWRHQYKGAEAGPGQFATFSVGVLLPTF